jgi:hypothetical protein
MNSIEHHAKATHKRRKERRSYRGFWTYVADSAYKASELKTSRYRLRNGVSAVATRKAA